MSAYKEFKSIQFIEPLILIAALTEMGYKVEFGESMALHGYHGDVRPERAQIVVRRRQLSSASNDLGFAWNGQAFTPIISEFDAAHVLTQEWRDKLQATYSKIAVLRFLQTKGAAVQAIETNEQGLVIQATMEV